MLHVIYCFDLHLHCIISRLERKGDVSSCMRSCTSWQISSITVLLSVFRICHCMLLRRMIQSNPSVLVRISFCKQRATRLRQQGFIVQNHSVLEQCREGHCSLCKLYKLYVFFKQRNWYRWYRHLLLLRSSTTSSGGSRKAWGNIAFSKPVFQLVHEFGVLYLVQLPTTLWIVSSSICTCKCNVSLQITGCSLVSVSLIPVCRSPLNGQVCPICSSLGVKPSFSYYKARNIARSCPLQIYIEATVEMRFPKVPQSDSATFKPSKRFERQCQLLSNLAQGECIW